MTSHRKPDFLYELPHIREGLDHLLRRDPVFKKLDAAPEDLKWSYTKPGFSSLARIITAQQVSTAAARTIYARLEDAAGTMTPENVLKLSVPRLREAGLSGSKVKFLHALAEAIQEGTFDPKALEKLPDADIYEKITALHGFGRWSAEMYLMFSLARPDIWPAGDLGIQEGLKLYLNKRVRPTPEQTMKEGKRFAPHRTAASILLWHLKAVAPVSSGKR